MTKKIGILLTNTGTPLKPDTLSVRRYLREFLSDKRIVQLPRAIWLPILYGLVLPLRAPKSAKLYQKIWSVHGAPMRIYMQEIAAKLQLQFPQAALEIGMNYSEPSIACALKKLQEKNIEQLIVLPLFPQYSNTTSAASFDRVMRGLKKYTCIPSFSFVHSYATHPLYIEALAKSIETHWQQHQPEHLLISFHGIPKRFIAAGDIYQTECEQTANLLAERLKLPANKWTLCYQSQFGYDKWLEPSTQKLLQTLPKKNIKHLDVICPGFAVDCLETLEEIAIRGKEIFLHAGGLNFRYIPALNAEAAQVAMLRAFIETPHCC